MEEKELLYDLKNGNYEAFTRLYHIYKNKTYYFVKGLLHSHEDTLNVIQDVFLKIWEKRTMIDETKSFKSWIFTIVYHSAVDFLRMRSREVQINEINYYSTADSTNLASRIADRDLLNQILKIVETFPPRQKEIFIMSRFDGLSHKEIAEKLDIAEKTVENLIGRSLSTLKSLIYNNLEIF